MFQSTEIISAHSSRRRGNCDDHAAGHLVGRVPEHYCRGHQKIQHSCLLTLTYCGRNVPREEHFHHPNP